MHLHFRPRVTSFEFFFLCHKRISNCEHLGSYYCQNTQGYAEWSIFISGKVSNSCLWKIYLKIPYPFIVVVLHTENWVEHWAFKFGQHCRVVEKIYRPLIKRWYGQYRLNTTIWVKVYLSSVINILRSYPLLLIGTPVGVDKCRPN